MVISGHKFIIGFIVELTCYLDVAMAASKELPADGSSNFSSGLLTGQAFEVAVNSCTPINKL